MRLVRWILILPGAVLVGMIGSLVGGIVATPFGQSAMDTSSAFFGTFAFVCASGVIAPSRRSKVTLVVASLFGLLALLRFSLSVFSTVEEYAGLPTTEKVLIPIAQVLGSLYASFILPPFVTQGSTLERLWREIIALGTVVGTFGALIALIGLILGLLGREWFGLSAGIGVLFLGVLTWLFPFVHVTLRVKRAKTMMKQHIEEIVDRNSVNKVSGLKTEERSFFQQNLNQSDQRSAPARNTLEKDQECSEFPVTTGIAEKAITPEIGREISWADIVRHVFRVLEFDKAGTTIGPNNQVHALSASKPYGYLLVESPIVDRHVRLPIIHRDDFLLAAGVFDEPTYVDLVTEEELLVTYAPKKILPGGFSGGHSHALHYAITPSGTLDRYYSKDNGLHMAKPEPELLLGTLVYEGEIGVHMNFDPEF